MLKKIFTLTAAGILAIAAFTSCKKSTTALAPAETYQLKGRIDASRTTIATAALTSATFNITYNTPDAFGNAQSVLNGSFALTGYTGIPVSTQVMSSSANNVNTADTLSFFSSQGSGVAISYITIPTSFTGAAANNVFGNYITNLYTYNNTANASFTITNFSFTNDITQSLKTGNGYFRLGKYPKYVYILLDQVTKL